MMLGDNMEVNNISANVQDGVKKPAARVISIRIGGTTKPMNLMRRRRRRKLHEAVTLSDRNIFDS
jgi:hypothetical protein